jgi:N-acetyltransferase
MRQYTRNVRRAWDGDEYRPPKRIRLQKDDNNTDAPANANKENIADTEDALERAIRETSVAALSSSPSRKNSTVFSGESMEEDRATTITPPSSPPPVPALQLTPPKAAPRKPTFSILDKSKKDKPKQPLKRKHDASLQVRRDSSVPLTEIHNSSQFPTRPSSSTPAPEPVITTRPPLFPGLMKDKDTTSKPLTQTRLDFGQSLAPVTCPSPDCLMTYAPSSEPDVALHNMYHNRHSHGIELGKPFLKSAMKWCYEVPSIPGSVVVVDRKISLPSRKVVQKVLEVVNKELGSVDINEEELWSQRAVPGDADESRKCDRYKAFLHVIDGKCVAIALAERISKCYRVLPDSTPSADAGEKMDLALQHGGAPKLPQQQENPQYPSPSPTNDGTASTSGGVEHHALSLSKQTYPAVVGVSRIWTSKTFRRKGIANNLLDCVVNQFIYGMEIDRAEVAFSQPTDSGAALAKGWFEDSETMGKAGWRVYVED